MSGDPRPHVQLSRFQSLQDVRARRSVTNKKAGPILSLSFPPVAAAFEADRTAAHALASALHASGRGAHPAIAHLEMLLSREPAPADLEQIAAVAFEAAVRVHLGAVAEADVSKSGGSDHLDGLLVSRPAMPWEAESHCPLVEVDWRKAMDRMSNVLIATAARARSAPQTGADDGAPSSKRSAHEAQLTAKRPATNHEVAGGGASSQVPEFHIDPEIPGASLAWHVARSRRARIILLGDSPRDEVLDPVSAYGAFLAQAMPGFADIDMLLRSYRLKTAAQG